MFFFRLKVPWSLGSPVKTKEVMKKKPLTDSV